MRNNGPVTKLGGKAQTQVCKMPYGLLCPSHLLIIPVVRLVCHLIIPRVMVIKIRRTGIIVVLIHYELRPVGDITPHHC